MPAFDITLRFLGAIGAGYLLGAIPTGVIVSRLAGGVDPRLQGSRKTGATNILRTQGPAAAAVVLLVDLLKGVAAVLLARYVLFGAIPHPGLSSTTWGVMRDSAEALAAVAALLGHNYSVFIGFKGGRGVLTATGAMTTMSPVATLFAALGGIPATFLTRYVSLGSILGAILGGSMELFLVLIGRDSWPHAAFIILAAMIIVIAHKDNIQRLRAGVERKLGEKADGHGDQATDTPASAAGAAPQS
ncbi:MAG TPA: glycerol-3-phosphate 1-O-acyltransferase PlsY [Ktedonobacterales bacterium]